MRDFAAATRALDPRVDVATALQTLFLVDNPNPEAARDRLDRPAGDSAYADVHARLHPRLRAVARERGYGDLFLIEPAEGRVVYTVAKRADLGTSLLTGPFRATRLSRAFRAARAAIDADFVRMVDFESYPPARGAPTAFVAAPVFDHGRRLGVVALEVPIDRINAVMTGEHRWEGLGSTGETYLVGDDHRLRSDSRLFLAAPAEYLDTIARTGVPADVVSLIGTHRRTVLFQPVTGPAITAALGGESGAATARDERDEPVLTSYAPLDIPDLRWAVVAKIDLAEAFAPALALRRSLAVTGIVVALVVAGVAILLARSLTAPIHRLIAAMGTLGRGDLASRLTERRRDEIGQIAAAFNRMAGDLQETTVSRDHVRGILDAMSDAVIVVRAGDGAGDWRDAVVRAVNPAACAMLGRPAERIVGQRMGSLIAAIVPPETAAPAVPPARWLEDVLREGRIDAREAVYRIRGGEDREVPVLFSSAVVARGATAAGEIVCAAHDLTTLKAMEARSAFIRETFGRYVSDDVVASLLASPEALALGGQLRKVTIVMTDLRGFTALAERLTPEEAIRFLNGYLQTMVDLVLRHGGTINEILGDGILVIFGAPTAMPDDAERAVRCALEMQRAMGDVNARSRERGLPEIEMGIVIHTGEVIVGNIGSPRRMKYAAVGAAVNLTGRIESYTTGGQILISDATRREVDAAARLGRALEIEPKGARERMTVWELTGLGDDLALPAAESKMPVLAADVPIRYALVDQKHVGREVFDGAFVRLGAHGAEIRSARGVPPLSNVKIWIGDAAAGEAEALYAKVVEVTAAGFVVRFTGAVPAVARRLAAG
jgi:class 3 adenylate cyclase/PAS domain-containing protein